MGLRKVAGAARLEEDNFAGCCMLNWVVAVKLIIEMV